MMREQVAKHVEPTRFSAIPSARDPEPSGSGRGCPTRRSAASRPAHRGAGSARTGRCAACVVTVGGLDVGDERRAEHLLTSAHTLQRDPVTVEHRHRRWPRQTLRRAVHVEGRLTGTATEPSPQHQLIVFHPLDVAEPHHVVDAAQLLQLVERHDGAVIHRGLHRRIEAQQVLVGLQPGEEGVQRVRLGDRRASASRSTPGAVWRTAVRAARWRGSAARSRAASTQRNRSAGTPLRSSHRQQSMPVLPPPTIV